MTKMYWIFQDIYIIIKDDNILALYISEYVIKKEYKKILKIIAVEDGDFDGGYAIVVLVVGAIIEECSNQYLQ